MKRLFLITIITMSAATINGLGGTRVEPGPPQMLIPTATGCKGKFFMTMEQCKRKCKDCQKFKIDN